MEWKGEMGKECGSEVEEKKRPKQQGDLIQEQQKESKEHGGEDLRFVIDSIRTGETGRPIGALRRGTLYQAPRPAWPGARKDH